MSCRSFSIECTIDGDIYSFPAGEPCRTSSKPKIGSLSFGSTLRSFLLSIASWQLQGQSHFGGKPCADSRKQQSAELELTRRGLWPHFPNFCIGPLLAFLRSSNRIYCWNRTFIPWISTNIDLEFWLDTSTVSAALRCFLGPSQALFPSLFLFFDPFFFKSFV